MDVAAVVPLMVAAIALAGPRPAVVPLAYLAAVTPALCRVDLREHRLPNRLVLPGYAAAGAGVMGEWFVTGDLPLMALVAGAAYLGFLLALSFGGGMGMGDVKLAGVLGLAAGLLGAGTAVLSPVLAFTAGGVAAVVALRRGPGSRIPFGPFLLAGFWIAILAMGVLPQR